MVGSRPDGEGNLNFSEGNRMQLKNGNPYRISPPAILNFSGGRSSAYMLIAMIAAYGGQLPQDIQVCFSNTGKERQQTLDFVLECSNYLGVPIRWLERDGSQPPRHRFREVDYETAARCGEPFEEIINEKQYLPNPVTRFCSVELKIRVMRDFAFSLGWTEWNNVIGLRADEAHRFDRAFRSSGDGEGKQISLLNPRIPMELKPRKSRPHDAWNHLAAPMIEAGVTRQTVLDFWAEQPFDLQLRPDESNCDLCFLKGAGKISDIIREHPGMADWWIKMETVGLSKVTGKGGTFRKDRPDYAHMAEAVRLQRPIDFGAFDDMMTCGTNACTE